MSEDEHFEITYAKYFDFSRSCVRLIKNGFPIIEIEDSFYFDSNYHHQLSIEIGRLATSIGGCNICMHVLRAFPIAMTPAKKDSISIAHFLWVMIGLYLLYHGHI